MQVSITEGARQFLKDKGASAVTVTSLLFSSCCSGPLPPEVKPGEPNDSDGFDQLPTPGLIIYYDSLLDSRPEVIIDVKDYGSYRELFVQGWE